MSRSPWVDFCTKIQTAERAHVDLRQDPPFPAKPAFESFGTICGQGVSLSAFTGGLSGAILSDDRVGRKSELRGSEPVQRDDTGLHRTECSETPARLKLKCPATSTKCPGLGHLEFV
jgi:hypothetical protein